jgi:hypothetical protein
MHLYLVLTNPSHTKGVMEEMKAIPPASQKKATFEAWLSRFEEKVGRLDVTFITLVRFGPKKKERFNANYTVSFLYKKLPGGN